MKHTIELDHDVADAITLQSLISSYDSMVEGLEKYEDPEHEWIAYFVTDEEEDKRQIKKMRDALSLVINHWYGGSVPEHEEEVVAGECSVNLIRENEDGSADYSFNFPEEAMQALTRLGIMTAIKAGIEDAKRLNPDEHIKKEFTDEIKALAEKAGFVTWGGERWNIDNHVVDWAGPYDDELVKFYHLVRGIK